MDIKKWMIILIFSTCCLAGDSTYPPAYTSKDLIIRHTAYMLKYNKGMKVPDWVSYKLTNSMVNGIYERQDNFKEDPSISGGPKPDDYVKSGYDRGHQCPAGDMSWSETALSESFYMTNVCPQVSGFNRGIWKELEDQVRKWAVENKELYITVGPCQFYNSKIGNQVAIPVYFYKVVLDLKGKKGIGFIFPNKSSNLPLQNFAVSIDSVESFTKINFFAKVPASIENPIEKKVDLKKWFK